MHTDKQSPPAHPHYGHRKRVRNLFLQSGLDGFADHNVLELLLFYAIPKSDTNTIAHDLIDRFGSLRGVLDASVEELCAVKGMGEYSATFLSILPQLARRYYTDGSPKETQIRLEDSDAIQAYLRSRFVGESSECVYLLAFGSSGQMRSCVKVTSGTSTRVLFDERMLLEAAFRTGAASVILAHNHPGGAAAPSNEDVDATKVIKDRFNYYDIPLVDHVIVAGDQSFSMANHPRFYRIFTL